MGVPLLILHLLAEVTHPDVERGRRLSDGCAIISNRSVIISNRTAVISNRSAIINSIVIRGQAYCCFFNDMKFKHDY